MNHRNIKVHTTIDKYNIKFDLTRNEIRSILGEPSSVDKYDVTDLDKLECWNYDALQLELIFESDSDYRLSKMSFFSNKTKINDIAIIGMNEKVILKKIPGLYLQDEKDEIGYSYEYPGENMLIWVSLGFVKNVSIYR